MKRKKNRKKKWCGSISTREGENGGGFYRYLFPPNLPECLFASNVSATSEERLRSRPAARASYEMLLHPAGQPVTGRMTDVGFGREPGPSCESEEKRADEENSCLGFSLPPANVSLACASCFVLRGGNTVSALVFRRDSGKPDREKFDTVLCNTSA